jgi:hypothetical protein
VFRRGVTSMIGNGVPSFQFNEINGLAGVPLMPMGVIFGSAFTAMVQPARTTQHHHRPLRH